MLRVATFMHQVHSNWEVRKQDAEVARHLMARQQQLRSECEAYFSAQHQKYVSWESAAQERITGVENEANRYVSEIHDSAKNTVSALRHEAIGAVQREANAALYAGR